MRADHEITSDKLYLAVAGLLVCMGLAYAYLSAPTRLTVAVGPAGSPDENLLRAFSGQLRSQKIAVRLTVLPVEDVRAAADALDKGRAELAVIRSDVAVPVNGLTLSVLRDAAAILIAPTENGITDIPGLAGKTLGVAVGHEADTRFVETILSHFDLGPPTVTVTPLTRETALAELKAGHVDAIAFVAPPAGTVASAFVRSVAAAYGGAVTIVPVENPDSVVQRSPGASTATIPESVWGGRPKIPDREVKTVGVSYRLMAHSDVDRSVAALVTESLFQNRTRLATAARSAIFMRAPETETASAATSASLPNHPGAVDYFQREQQSVMDRYGDWIYLLAFFGSGLASLMAGMWQRFRRRRRESIDDVLDRLLAILADARSAETATRLDELTVEIDDLLAIAVTQARDGNTGSRTTSALVLALDGARAAIEDRRRHLSHAGPDASRRPDGTLPRLVTVS